MRIRRPFGCHSDNKVAKEKKKLTKFNDGNFSMAKVIAIEKQNVTQLDCKTCFWNNAYYP
jgi:hypothetical protein